jgi:hypothetical protein
VKADIELQPLSDINNIFTRLKQGRVAGRVVIDFAGAAAKTSTKSEPSKVRQPEPA